VKKLDGTSSAHATAGAEKKAAAAATLPAAWFC
jgi:hypothetical protein